MMLLFALASIALLAGTAVGSVVINEVEQNPPGDERARLSQSSTWIELYNNDDKDADIGGWSIITSEGLSVTMQKDTIIQSLGYYILADKSLLLAHTGEVLILKNETGAEVDRTPSLSDTEDNELAWTRDPDGRDTNSSDDWKFLPSSRGF